MTIAKKDPSKIIVTQTGCVKVSPNDYVTTTRSITFSTSATIQDIIDTFKVDDISELRFSNFYTVESEDEEEDKYMNKRFKDILGVPDDMG